MGKRGRHEQYYTVYLNSTDEIIACGTAQECARQLGMAYSSFRSSVCKHRSGEWHKYTFVVEDSPYDEEV